MAKNRKYPCCIGASRWEARCQSAPSKQWQFILYKVCFSILMMALGDSEYTFLYVDVDVQRSVSDGGV